jgi:hypothetical protein
VTDLDDLERMHAEPIDMATLDDAPPARAPDPWLSRRKLLWGASDLPLLFASRGWLSTGDLTKTQCAELQDNRAGIPRYLARKAGLMGDRKGQSQAKTLASELKLLETWTPRYALAAGVDPASVRHASSWPQEWMPLRDAECDSLGATPDAYGRDVYDGTLVMADCKCPPDDDAWSRWGKRWSVQMQGQMAVTRASRALVIVGNRWAIPGAAGSVTHHEVERDESVIARIREACEDAWATVQRLIEGGKR